MPDLHDIGKYLYTNKAVAKVPVLPVFDPKKSKRKFSRPISFYTQILKMHFYCFDNKVIKSGVVQKQKRSRGVRYTQDKRCKDFRLLFLGGKTGTRASAQFFLTIASVTIFKRLIVDL